MEQKNNLATQKCFGQQIKEFFDFCPDDGNDREIGYHEKLGLFYVNNITKNCCYFVDIYGDRITGSEHDGRADNTISSLCVRDKEKIWIVEYDSDNKTIRFVEVSHAQPIQ